jgi:hypothetical protein
MVSAAFRRHEDIGNRPFDRSEGVQSAKRIAGAVGNWMKRYLLFDLDGTLKDPFR